MTWDFDELYQLFLKSSGISTDTRSLVPGSIFFALGGENFDGNQFAGEALSKGAVAAVIDKREFEGPNCILVDNALQALQELSQIHRSHLDIPVIAITGSNGKTTTKELIREVMSSQFQVTSTVKNYNNHIGVPLTLLSIQPGTQIAIVEMGTNQKGEIGFLCRLADPTHGLITSIGAAHLEGLGTINGVLEEKTSLYRHLADKNGVVFFDYRNHKLNQSLPLTTENLGYSKESSLYSRVEIKQSFPSIILNINQSESKFELNSPMYGDYNVLNMSAALTVGEYFGISTAQIIGAIAAYAPENNRSQVVRVRGADIYLDAYNANPSSVKLALKSFFGSEDQGKICILGDMLELGELAREYHLDILKYVQAHAPSWDRAIFVGPIFSDVKGEICLNDRYLFFERTEELESWFSKLDIKNKSILLKASRGLSIESILG